MQESHEIKEIETDETFNCAIWKWKLGFCPSRLRSVEHFSIFPSFDVKL